MGLISLCNNSKCWMRHKCYRWMQRTKPGDVCTQVEVTPPKDGEDCHYCVPLMRGDILRTDGK
jgi:hypothetical protein